MRPRVWFAVLSAAGAVLHLFLLRSPARSPLPLLAYGGWLLVSAVVVVAIARSSARGDTTVSPRQPPLRPRPMVDSSIEGLLWFASTAAGGLLIHLLSLFTPSTQRSVQRGMWLIFFLFAIGSYMQMRGATGDKSAPVPDHSPVAKAASRLRKAIGWILGGIGALILLRGVSFFSGGNARSADFIEVLFLAGGALLLLVGVAVLRAPSREDA